MVKNSVQKNFEKEIKKLDKQGKISNYNHSKYEIDNTLMIEKRKKKISFIAIVFVLWNIFALTTWIVPKYKIHIPILESNQKRIGSYVESLSKIDNSINELTSLIEVAYGQGNKEINDSNVLNLEKKFSEYKVNFKVEHNSDLENLRVLSQKKIDICLEIINLLKQKDTKSQRQNLNILLGECNRYNSIQRDGIISLFKENNINYRIDPNTNEVHFSYMDNEFQNEF